ncbi:hypothetical protein KM043_012326 [Ampulex compressa]|nr:hypothetical protein KM043_012326 [Ampulex compressa]
MGRDQSPVREIVLLPKLGELRALSAGVARHRAEAQGRAEGRKGNGARNRCAPPEGRQGAGGGPRRALERKDAALSALGARGRRGTFLDRGNRSEDSTAVRAFYSARREFEAVITSLGRDTRSH